MKPVRTDKASRHGTTAALAFLAENSVPKQLPVTFTRVLKMLERSLGALLPSYLNQHGIAVLDM